MKGKLDERRWVELVADMIFVRLKEELSTIALVTSDERDSASEKETPKAAIDGTATTDLEVELSELRASSVQYVSSGI
jgi:hypothetical protein